MAYFPSGSSAEEAEMPTHILEPKAGPSMTQDKPAGWGQVAWDAAIFAAACESL